MGVPSLIEPSPGIMFSRFPELHSYTLELREGTENDMNGTTWNYPPPRLLKIHSDYSIFSMESQPKPPFVTGILGGGKTEGIAYNKGVFRYFHGWFRWLLFFQYVFFV